MLDYWRPLLAQGGPVLPWILLASSLMWTLIVAQFLALRRLAVRVTPTPGVPRAPRIARRLRAQRLANLGRAARRHLPLIRALVQVLPLLGLLGTVSGLVHTFEHLAVNGASERRAIASGIAEALCATLTGLLAALLGLACMTHLDLLATRLRDRVEQASS